MPSFTKSVSVALLVIASNNVLAAPFKESTAVDVSLCLLIVLNDVTDYMHLLLARSTIPIPVLSKLAQTAAISLCSASLPR